MKSFLFLSYFLAAAQAGAQQVCSSLYVYQPWKSCATSANGTDPSKREVVVQEHDEETGWIEGGHNQAGECNKLAARLNSLGADIATVGVGRPNTSVGNPPGEDSKKPAGIALYKYYCKISAYKAPYLNRANAACGVESDTWRSEEPGKSLAGLEGSPQCLSCEDVAGAKDRLVCLKNMVEQVIAPKKVALKKPELDAVLAQVQKLKAMQDAFPKTFSVDDALELPKLEASIKQATEDLH